jgi:hypothetical protein
MANSNSTPVGTMICGQGQPLQDAHCTTRKVSFIFYCAPRDDGGRNPIYTAVYGHDAARTGVTDSASYLSNLPYVVVDADTKSVIYPPANSPSKLAVFGNRTSSSGLHDGTRNVHALPPINIPDNVSRIALHIANDAYPQHRSFMLFPWNVPNAAHSKVHVYEIRTDLQDRFTTENQLGNVPAENSIAPKPGEDNEYFCYLNGDLWLQISHEFTNAEIPQLCPPETLSRAVLGGSAQGISGDPSQTAGVPGQNGSGDVSGRNGAGMSSAYDTTAPAPTAAGNESLAVDWATTLLPIYSVGANSRSLEAFNVPIPNLGITLRFAARAVANAINTSSRTTVQQALRRTSPRAFAAILKAAWRLNIDSIDLSSSWRPMLGSRLHKMGVGLDVTEIVDSSEHINFRIHNHGAADRRRPFPISAGGKKLARLYDELRGDRGVSAKDVYTPWLNWVEPHDTHMHITVKYD